MFSLNPLVIPHIPRNVRASLALQVAVTEHKRMSQTWKDNPCNNDPAYSFNRCVKNSLSKIIGCRDKYDSSTAVDVPACSTVEQVFEFGSLWGNISTSEKREIEALTGCLGPCFYRSYEVIGEEKKQGFGLNLATKVLTVEEEVWDYPFLSFFAEVAGAEGVFFGFSLFSLLFIVDIIFMKMGKC